MVAGVLGFTPQAIDCRPCRGCAMEKLPDKPLIPDYAAPDLEKERSSKRYGVAEFLWLLFAEIVVQIVLPLIASLVLILLWPKGSFRKH